MLSDLKSPLIVLRKILTQSIQHLDLNLAMLLSHEDKKEFFGIKAEKANYLQRVVSDLHSNRE